MSLEPRSEDFSVIVRDENLPRSEIVEILLQLSSAQLTARDLIAERVQAECDKHLFDTKGKLATRLVSLDPKEQRLNGERTVNVDDSEKQIKKALNAFEANGFILLVDDHQIEALDEEIQIKPETVVTFLKLTPLVGG